METASKVNNQPKKVAQLTNKNTLKKKKDSNIGVYRGKSNQSVTIKI
jgi:hypothetical protein